MKVRPAYVADQFYPGNPTLLRSSIQTYLETASVPTAQAEILGIIAPHAGYVFSGATAGCAYRSIQGASPGRILLLGVSHRYRFEGLSLYDGDAFDTPLGQAPVDTSFIKMLNDTCLAANAIPHEHEHTLETQVPFILHSFGKMPIVPVLLGTPAREEHIDMGMELAELLSPGDLVIASTDMSHFLTEDEARAIDRHTLEIIADGDIKRLVHELDKGACSMCGAAAVVTALACCAQRGAGHNAILDYRTSGPVSKDYSRVVGYAAIACSIDNAAN